MQRNAIRSAIDVFMGRHLTETVMKPIRESEAHPRHRSIGHHELEALMKQLSRAPRRG